MSMRPPASRRVRTPAIALALLVIVQSGPGGLWILSWRGKRARYARCRLTPCRRRVSHNTLDAADGAHRLHRHFRRTLDQDRPAAPAVGRIGGLSSSTAKAVERKPKTTARRQEPASVQHESKRPRPEPRREEPRSAHPNRQQHPSSDENRHQTDRGVMKEHPRPGANERGADDGEPARAPRRPRKRDNRAAPSTNENARCRASGRS